MAERDELPDGVTEIGRHRAAAQVVIKKVWLWH
jgi:hypothetical protein